MCMKLREKKTDGFTNASKTLKDSVVIADESCKEVNVYEKVYLC